jgi:glycine/D-amino acid oxidase-like deaminating enzyme
VILGGGYTGMWTAWFLGEIAPEMRIVLLESDICGGGPSGRNGGFLHGWWEYLPFLAKRYGPAEGLRIAEAADEVVTGIGDWCRRHGVDAHFTPHGYLRVNAFPRVANDWGGTPAEMDQLGAPGQLVHMHRAAVQAVCASPVFGEGLFMPSAATVQPALLARGLRRVLLERGVQIHEGTTVERVEPQANGMQLTAPRGTVRADRVVLAVNAWAAGWPGFRTRVLAWGSYMVVTEPIPARLSELGWTGGEAIADSRFTISYFRTTRDGRIAFGAGVGAAGFDGRIGPIFTDDRQAIARVVANFRHLFPMLADVRFDDAWGGPIDITADRFPEIGSRDGGRVLYAHGFAGNGVGPARLAGRILAARIAGGSDPVANLPLFGRQQRFLPPEPFRYIGARAIREALIQQDDALDAGRRPGILTRLVAQVPGLLGYRFKH